MVARARQRDVDIGGDPAVRQHQHAIRQQDRLVHVMRHQQRGGQMRAPQIGDQPVHADPRQRVQGRERLVQQQQARLAHQGAGEGHALRLTARQRRGPRIKMALQPHLAQRRLGPATRIAPAQTQRHVAPHLLPRQQTRLLERHRHRVGQRDPRIRRRRVQARKRAQQRRLARSAAAQQGRERPRRQIEVERVEHRVRAEAARQAADRNPAGVGMGC
jgi:hypothetical protein